MSTQAWIFQGNPLMYDIKTYLTQERYIYWSIYFPAHIKAISPGDEVFLWRASKGKFISGIIGYGRVMEPCLPDDEISYPEKLRNDLWLKGSDSGRPKVGISLYGVRWDLASGMLPRDYLKTDPTLSQMEIMRFSNATSFRLKPEERKRILELWDIVELSISDEQPYQTFVEGGVNQVTIKQYIRNQQARESCIAQKGCICCVCGFDYAKAYGEIGVGYIQVHHLRQVSEQAKSYNIDPAKDLVPVCANCHAMLHKRKPPYSPDELASMIKC
jgi:hypothetical protein